HLDRRLRFHERARIASPGQGEAAFPSVLISVGRVASLTEGTSGRDNRASGKTGGSNTRHTRIYRTPVPMWVMLVGNQGTCDHEWLVIHGGISSSVVMSVPSSSLGLNGTATKRRRHGTYTQELPGPHRRR